MKNWLIALFAALSCSACTDYHGAQRTLEAAGYKNITLDGYAFFSCGKDDVYQTKFRAQGLNGSNVSGAVCSGLMKNNTIRTD